MRVSAGQYGARREVCSRRTLLEGSIERVQLLYVACFGA